MFLPSLLLGGVFLDACVERVVNKCGALCGLMIVVRHERKSAADQLQAASCLVVIQLTLDIRRLHDASHFQ